jgi:hypothetical protein
MKPFLALLLALLLVPAWELRGQATLTNDDLPNLVKSGLSEDFLLDLIDRQGSGLSTTPSRLAELKNRGVSERLITAVVKKSPPAEPITGDAVLTLVNAGFSENFIIELVNQQPIQFAADPNRIVELKQAGVTERILTAMVAHGSARTLPAGSAITVRLIDSIDSEKNDAGDRFRASLEEPIRVGDRVIAPRGAEARIKLAAEKESGKLTGKTGLSVQLVSFGSGDRTVALNSSSVVQESGSRGARTAKSAAATGAIGAMIGAIAGGGTGAAIGAGAGAAAGAGAQVFMKGQRVRIPSETVLTFTTQDVVRLP